MRVLIALTYYRPHYSGLTIYAERLARGLARRGHQVTVLTSRYDPNTPASEVRDGVRVIRLPVRLRVSKGVIMPSILLRAWRLIREADVVHLHLPQLDAAPLAAMARLMGRPVVLTYHCDLRLPKGLVHYVANQVSHLANHVAAQMANAIVTNTRDYAENSAYLRPYLAKVRAIFPPVEVAAVTEAGRAAFRERARVRPGQRLIGMAARLATEKGAEYLAEALPTVLAEQPQARVLFVGQHQNVFGEEAYARRMAPLIEKLGEHWTFLGNLPPEEFAAFLQECELTVLPSLNSTESFGMVQMESMVCGTPVVATDLPGVRQPVRLTGMGEIVPPANAEALAKAILRLMANPGQYRHGADHVRQQFAAETIAEQYEKLFEAMTVRAQATKGRLAPQSKTKDEPEIP
jgi:glycosyltransferase involved in cell wall biosynthesis